MAESKLAARKPGPGRPRSQEAEEAILDATAHLLAELGYGAVTTDKIAARARVSKSTIYRRWPSKEHLAIAALGRSEPLKVAGKGNAQDELVEALAQFAGLVRGTPLAGLLLTLLGERVHNPALAAELDRVIEQRRWPVKAIVQRAVERKELPAGTDIEMAVDAVIGPVIVRLFFLPGDVGRKAIRQSVAIALRGLGATI
jgi:AcrR family transcriptional regulator